MDIVIIKERSGILVSLRTCTNRSALDYLDALFEEARKDFPGLLRQFVRVNQYGTGEARTFGIRFIVPSGRHTR